MVEAARYRFDDLRRFGAALASAAGVPPARASALATHLLWFDAAGVSDRGIAGLPKLLEAIADKSIDPRAEGRVVGERTATAVFDAGKGVPLLALDRAGGIAVEKARDVGVGAVRVKNIAHVGSAAGIAAEVAIGPHAAFVLGPDSAWSIALPCAEGLPVVFDPTLATSEGVKKSKKARDRGGPPPALAGLIGPWAAILLERDEWLIVALSIAAIEGVSAFHERVAETVAALDAEPGTSPGRLLPASWEARRRDVRERGVPISEERREALREWAGNLSVDSTIINTDSR